MFQRLDFALIRLSKKGNSFADDVLEESPGFLNAYLSKGAYQYWKNKSIDSLPLIKKDYKNGIDLIKKSLQGDKYIRYLALHQLAWIYYVDKLYEESIVYCQTGLEEFENSRLFLNPLAECYKKLKKENECSEIYEKLINSYKTGGYEKRFINVKICTKLAELYNKMGNFDKSIELASYVKKLDLSDKERKVSKNYLKRCSDLLKEKTN